MGASARAPARVHHHVPRWVPLCPSGLGEVVADGVDGVIHLLDAGKLEKIGQPMEGHEDMVVGPLADDTGVRLAVELPNRWPSNRPVPVERCVEAIDRPDGATLWDEHNRRPCAVPRWALIKPPPGA